jgi:hypothetical protein
VVAGNPARVVRQRFPAEICQAITESRWWDLPPWECVKYSASMSAPLERAGTAHALLGRRHDSECGVFTCSDRH